MNATSAGIARRGARKLFGRKHCVVTNATTGVDWHHLSERGREGYWYYLDLVPIRRDFNQAIDDHRKALQGARHIRLPFPLGLERHALFSRAQGAFGEGDYRKSYGCSRLGASLELLHNDDSNWCLMFASHALVSARPLGRVDAATDTLKTHCLRAFRNIRTPSSVTAETRAVLATEIGSWFREYGAHARAIEWLELASECLARVDQLVIVPALAERIPLHRALAELSGGNVAAAAKWFDNVREMMSAPKYPFGRGNYVFWRSVLDYYTKGRMGKDAALDRQSEVIEESQLGEDAPPPWCTIWTFIEVLLFRATLFRGGGRGQHADRLIDVAKHLMHECKVLPTATVPSLSPLHGARTVSELGQFHHHARVLYDLIRGN